VLVNPAFDNGLSAATTERPP